MSPQQKYVLFAASQCQPYIIVRLIANRVRPVMKQVRAYHHVGELVRQGFMRVTGKRHERKGGRPTNLYELTAKGLEVLHTICAP